MPVDASTLERLVPAELDGRDVTGRQTLELHLERYRFAARCARPGRLLDLACGVGYGTRLVADEAAGVERALGVDLVAGRRRLRARALRARRASSSPRPTGSPSASRRASTRSSPSRPSSTCPTPARLVAHLAGMLRPGGVLVASAPTTPSTDVNLHHLHDFTESLLPAPLRGPRPDRGGRRSGRCSRMRPSPRSRARSSGWRTCGRTCSATT